MVKEKENIDELLSRYFSGESLPEEAMYVHDWKDESEENRLYFESCEKMFHGHIYKANIQKGWGNVKAQINNPKKPKSIITLWRAAAADLWLGLVQAGANCLRAGHQQFRCGQRVCSWRLESSGMPGTGNHSGDRRWSVSGCFGRYRQAGLARHALPGGDHPQADHGARHQQRGGRHQRVRDGAVPVP